MKYFQRHKKATAICLFIGLTIAIATRASFFIFTTDLNYFRINHVEYPAQIEFDPTNNGKRVVGISGFPFQTYSNCVMGFHGTVSRPACKWLSPVWEFSIILNTLFWGLICLTIFKVAKKYS